MLCVPLRSLIPIAVVASRTIAGIRRRWFAVAAVGEIPSGAFETGIRSWSKPALYIGGLIACSDSASWHLLAGLRFRPRRWASGRCIAKGTLAPECALILETSGAFRTTTARCTCSFRPVPSFAITVSRVAPCRIPCRIPCVAGKGTGAASTETRPFIFAGSTWPAAVIAWFCIAGGGIVFSCIRALAGSGPFGGTGAA